MPDQSLFGTDERGATLSPCGRYRYDLWRFWGGTDEYRTLVVFVGLNPSTADASKDDQTIRRCIGFAKAWGYDGLRMLNLYALRSTDPAALWRDHDPVGPQNNAHLRYVGADKIIVAWGSIAPQGRALEALALINAPVYCLGTTKNGAPRHPLYVRASQQPELYWSPSKETQHA